MLSVLLLCLAWELVCEELHRAHGLNEIVYVMLREVASAGVRQDRGVGLMA